MHFLKFFVIFMVTFTLAIISSYFAFSSIKTDMDKSQSCKELIKE